MGDTDKDGLYDYFDGLNILNATGSYWRNVINNNMGENGSWYTGPGAVGSVAQLPKSQVSDDCNVGDRDWRNIVILPIQIQLQGFLKNNAIYLQWNALGDKDIHSIDIERSFNGNIYTKIQSVQVSQNSVVDNFQNTSFYRLKIIYKSGDFYYSNVIVIKYNNVTFTLTPNPFVSYLNVFYTTMYAELINFNLLNSDGKKIKFKEIKTQRGTNNVQFTDLDKLPSGIYFLQIKILNDTKTYKVIK